MSMTIIDPDTIALPSVSSLGVGLSTLEEFELDFSQVRVFSVHRGMRSILWLPLSIYDTTFLCLFIHEIIIITRKIIFGSFCINVYERSFNEEKQHK